MRILELTNFSAGADGVWSRVQQEADLLSKRGHDVKVFSSDFIKGSHGRALSEENRGAIAIRRFHGKHLGGESFIRWFSRKAEKEALAFNPEVIIAHSYRHGHTVHALRKFRKFHPTIKIFLVTHAPFGDDSKRSFLAKMAVRYYDSFFGPSRELNSFTKIVIISPWEIPYLSRLRVSKEKIVCIPNGIPNVFFHQKKEKEENKILYFGRVSPIKDIETLLSAFALLKDTKIQLEIAGSAEEGYLRRLQGIVGEKSLEKRVTFTGGIYGVHEKIQKLDSARIYVLPSLREGMPQSLIEAMAREKLVIASDTLGAKDLITSGKNGFLFKIGDAADLAEKLEHALSIRNKKIQTEARKSVAQFNWNIIIEKIEQLIR